MVQCHSLCLEAMLLLVVACGCVPLCALPQSPSPCHSLAPLVPWGRATPRALRQPLSGGVFLRTCRPRYHFIKVDDARVLKVNVGDCAGTCGPDHWPDRVTGVEDFWTTACQVAATKTLVVGDGVAIEAVARCECRPVRPKCARVPHFVQHWGPGGTAQVVDIGRCLGRCPVSGQNCVPKFEESLVCAEPDGGAAEGSATRCGRFTVVTDCGCSAALG